VRQADVGVAQVVFGGFVARVIDEFAEGGFSPLTGGGAVPWDAGRTGAINSRRAVPVRLRSSPSTLRICGGSCWLSDSMRRYSKDFSMALRTDGSAARTCPQVNKKSECKCLLRARANPPHSNKVNVTVVPLGEEPGEEDHRD
jgi:hypothetical protein